jgi:hydroperoxy icosatetraenoate dehydratase/isomerase
MHRQLSASHPIYKLLLPHTRFQIGINSLGRAKLFSEDGIMTRSFAPSYNGMMTMIKKAFADFKFFGASFPEMLKKRNIPGPDSLPNYYYRDDGLQIWQAILTFTTGIVSCYYSSDKTVAQDTELEGWSSEIHEKGLHDHGFPKHIESREQLALVCAIFIWTVSCQHAVVNFAQYDSFGFVPATPAALDKEPPGWKGVSFNKADISYKWILAAMPSQQKCAEQVTILHVLSSYSSTDEMLGNYNSSLFVEKQALQVIDTFSKKLKQISEKIASRNTWDHLNPDKVPNSTAI